MHQTFTAHCFCPIIPNVLLNKNIHNHALNYPIQYYLDVIVTEKISDLITVTMYAEFNVCQQL